MRTVAGQVIKVLDPGVWNRDAGPDFLHARLQIDELIWVGHVEIHRDAQQWFAHGHQRNRQYDNVVLHVVWEGEQTIERPDGSLMPTLQLTNYVDSQMLTDCATLLTASAWIPCAAQLRDVPVYVHRQVLDRVLQERLLEKSKAVYALLEETVNDWEQVCLKVLAQAFGMRVNKDAFARLFTTFPLKLLHQYRGELIKLEALLFGQAGFLEEIAAKNAATHTAGEKIKPDYRYQLQEVYRHLRQLHQLTPMRSYEWRFLRMRPANFPTMRLAQLAAVIHKSSTIFHIILHENNIAALQSRFMLVEASSYWKEHYHFGKKSTRRHVATLSASFLQHLSINCFAVMRYAYGQYHARQHCQQVALDWLNQLPAEKNSLVGQFAKHGLLAQHAADSQAMVQLYQAYCTKKQCLSCAVGYHLLGNRRAIGSKSRQSL